MEHSCIRWGGEWSGFAKRMIARAFAQRVWDPWLWMERTCARSEVRVAAWVTWRTVGGGWWRWDRQKSMCSRRVRWKAAPCGHGWRMTGCRPKIFSPFLTFWICCFCCLIESAERYTFDRIGWMLDLQEISYGGPHFWMGLGALQLVRRWNQAARMEEEKAADSAWWRKASHCWKGNILWRCRMYSRGLHPTISGRSVSHPSHLKLARRSTA